ncbi:ferrochelatase [Limosilactobacillus urinaemulieris]|uniref:ferrochelatase n=1 Tax=Limosilactobacillus urinaemulieris TaxID=2742600 RepID=UPI0028F02352|nr:ferrochelatase [Limosilactobacillus urinaemulieris]
MKDYGLLLVNLGSPAEPTTPAVKNYLRQFLGDHNVVEMPPALWKPLLNGIILPMRSWRSATFYRDCWLKNGSPLIVNTKKLTAKVQQMLPEWSVKMAMTYGKPSISDTLRQMKQECKHIIVLSLFPHFTKSTTQSIIEQVQAVDPALPIIDRFADDPRYLTVLSNHIQEAWDNGNYDMLIISYHGIPVSMVKHGDPYQDETERTTIELKKRLTIPENQIEMAYQSKFGPMPWLKPYLKNRLLQLVQLGKRNILIVAPSFVTDCLETIEENSVQNYQTFRENGGNTLDVVSSLNDDSHFAEFIADLAKEQLN